MSTIQQSIFDAVDIIVDRAISQAGFDKTVSAIVVECVDEVAGKYKVKYQDSVYYATTDSASTKYSVNSEVYVLIPSGDFSKEKKILGTVKSLGANYITAVEGDQAYEYIGTNVVNAHDQLNLCSYRTEIKKLYDADIDDDKNIVKIDKNAINEYLKQSTHLIAGAEFKTKINKENRNYGNYGLAFGIEFKDDATQQLILKEYVVDVDNMLGQPYNFNTFTRQIEEFEINGVNFQRLKYINAFTRDFPKQDTSKADDIFIRNIEINGAVQIDAAALDSYYLSLLTPQGSFFPSSVDKKSLDLKAEIKIKGKVINNETHNVSFYWFVEHAGVDSRHVGFCNYGGQGWQCLNDSTLIEGVVENGEVISQSRVEWTPAGDTFTINRDECLAYQTKYKCVAVYGTENITLEKEIIIKNQNADFDIVIESSKGTEFSYDKGETTLTCKVDNPEKLEYNYYWSKKNNVGTYEALSETTEENAKYNKGLELKAAMESGFSSQSLIKSASYFARSGEYQALEDYIFEKLNSDDVTNEQFYNSVVSYLNDKSITRLENNVLSNLLVKTITNFTTYSCSVFKVNAGGTEQQIGNASIKITNSFDKQSGYNLIIHNGTQVFKYNEVGLSPTHKSNETPMEVPTMSFSLFDESGNKIEDDVVRRSCKVRWIVPSKETLITPKIDGEKVVGEDTITYTNSLIFDYDIFQTYNVNKTNNTIQLEVDYKGITVRAATNLTFLKEGEPGTNGTDFVCKIVPNIYSEDIPPQFPILTYSGSSQTMNYNIQEEGSNRRGTNAKTYPKWFKVQLYENAELVFEGYKSTGDFKLEWSFLSNKYTNKVSDESSFLVDTTGNFTSSGYKGGTIHPANIVKAVVTYNEKQYIATLPIVTVSLSNSNYKIGMKERTGFNVVTYNSDGVQPKYDSLHPFTIDLQVKENNHWVEIGDLSNNNTYKPSYTWTVKGQTYNKDTKKMVNANLLSQYTATNAAINEEKYRPATKYDGYCVNTGLEIIVKDGSTTVGSIHYPIHFMLNRFGMSALNDWDGNSIDINEEGGVILSPQVGAGKKNSDNTFTGVLMGVVDDPNDTTEKIGLLGYANGQRSIFLDAETGKAEFGTNGKGKIILDPTSDKAQLYSGNYSTTDKTGMMIDLTTPEIKFGSGKFHVNNNGELTATGGGSIAGWEIGTDALTKGNTGMASSGTYAFWAGSSTAANAKFSVTHAGAIKAESGTIGGFNIDAKNLWTGTATDSKTTSPGSGAVRMSTTNYAAKICSTEAEDWRFNIGNNFGVKNTGAMYCSNGVLGGWNINASNLTANGGKTVLSSSGTISVASGDFYVDSSGNTTIKGTLKTSGSVSIGGSCNISGKLDVSSCNSITVTGTLTVTGTGKIGGCSVNAAGLYGSGWSLTSSGLTCDHITMGNYSLKTRTVSFGNSYYRPGQSSGWASYVKSIEVSTDTVLGKTVVTGVSVTPAHMTFITGSRLTGTFVAADVVDGDASE